MDKKTKSVDIQKKNVYQKLQSVRVKLLDENLQKSGKNKYANFSYYELSDILPNVNRLLDEVGLMTQFRMTKKKAVLNIINTNKTDEYVSFSTPIAKVEIGTKKDGSGGAQPIQNLGGQITYMRRYLLMVAFEIVETDTVDSVRHSYGVHLDEKSIKLINETKSVVELTKVCSKIKKEKGTKYQKVLMDYYIKRKGELK